MSHLNEAIQIVEHTTAQLKIDPDAAASPGPSCMCMLVGSPKVKELKALVTHAIHKTMPA